MCLIDKVMSWDNQSIYCETASHKTLDNPLRLHNQLSSVHLIEYSAQAIAVHGGLLALKHNGTLRQGYLAAIKNAEFNIERLDKSCSCLLITATSVVGFEMGVVYRSTVYDDVKSVLFTAELSIVNR